jgi:hypothetical protein
MDLFETHIGSLPNATIDVLDGATHSLTGGAWSEAAMFEHLTTQSVAWIDTLSSGTRDGTRP